MIGHQAAATGATSSAADARMRGVGHMDLARAGDLCRGIGDGGRRPIRRRAMDFAQLRRACAVARVASLTLLTVMFDEDSVFIWQLPSP